MEYSQIFCSTFLSDVILKDLWLYLYFDFCFNRDKSLKEDPNAVSGFILLNHPA